MRRHEFQIDLSKNRLLFGPGTLELSQLHDTNVEVAFSGESLRFHMAVCALILRAHAKAGEIAPIPVSRIRKQLEVLRLHAITECGRAEPYRGPERMVYQMWRDEDRGIKVFGRNCSIRVDGRLLKRTKEKVAQVFRHLFVAEGTPGKASFCLSLNSEECTPELTLIRTPGLDSFLRKLRIAVPHSGGMRDDNASNDAASYVDTGRLRSELLQYLSSFSPPWGEPPLLLRLGLKLEDIELPLRAKPRNCVYTEEEARDQERFRPTAATPAARIFSPLAAIDSFAASGIALDQLNRNPGVSVILGVPGSGKTAWLTSLVRRNAATSYQQVLDGGIPINSALLPVYIPCVRLAAALSDAESVDQSAEVFQSEEPLQRLPAVLRMPCAAIGRVLIEDHSAGMELIRMFWRRMASKTDRGNAADVLICLDGWDEAPEPASGLVGCIRALATSSSACVYISSRTSGYADGLVPGTALHQRAGGELEICPLSNAQADDFVRRFFLSKAETPLGVRRQLSQNVDLAKLACNPLMATLLCAEWAARSEIPGWPSPCRIEVYRQIVLGMLLDWRAIRDAKPAEMELAGAKLDLLKAIASHYFPRTQIPVSDLTHFLYGQDSGYLTSLPDVHPLRRFLSEGASHSSLIKELADRDGLLVPSAGPVSSYLTFLHPTVQEFLTACAIAEEDNPISTAMRHIYDCRWTEVLALLGGLIGENRWAYVSALLRRNREDLACRPLEVAIRAAEEAGHSTFQAVPVDTLLCELVELEVSGLRLLPPIARIIRHVSALVAEHPNTSLELCRSLLASNDPDRRDLAILLLGYIGTGEALALLTPMLPRDSAKGHACAVLGMSRFPCIQTFRELVQISESDDTSISEAAEASMTDVVLSLSLDELDTLAQDADCFVRSGLARALGRQGSSAHMAVLSRLLEDPEPLVQGDAIDSITETGDSPACGTLLTLLQDDSCTRRDQVARVLGRLHCTIAIPGLRKLATQGADGERRGAVMALAALGDKTSMDYLKRLAQSDDWRDRKDAATALGRFGTEDAIQLLEALLLDHSEWVRRTAASALGQVPEATSFSALAPLLHDSVPDVRTAATVAVARLRHDMVFPAILDQLSDTDWQVREAAVDAVGALDPVHGSDALISCLDDSDWRVQAAAVRALSKTGPACLQHLLPILSRCVALVGMVVLNCAVLPFGNAEVLPTLVAELEADDFSLYTSSLLHALRTISGRRCCPVSPTLAGPNVRSSWESLDSRLTQLAKLLHA